MDVSLHRSEGFGLTLAQAMSLGKPAVATGYSANTEFMSAENGYLVPHRLVPVPEKCGPYPTTARWADPDVAEAARILRRLFEHPTEAREKGEQARRDMSKASRWRHAPKFSRGGGWTFAIGAWRSG